MHKVLRRVNLVINQAYMIIIIYILLWKNFYLIRNGILNMKHVIRCFFLNKIWRNAIVIFNLKLLKNVVFLYNKPCAALSKVFHKQICQFLKLSLRLWQSSLVMRYVNVLRRKSIKSGNWTTWSRVVSYFCESLPLFINKLLSQNWHW